MASTSTAAAAAPVRTITHHPKRVYANALRAIAMDAVEAAKSGHPGMPMGMADVATVLFSQFLKFDATAPTWPDRDRFILSAGHGSMLLYGLSHLLGYQGMAMDQLKAFRQLHALTPGHPELMPSLGIEMTTGPLGQGLATAVGFALAERIMANRFRPDLVNHKTYVICSDGDLMEGVSHEACSLAGHLKLNRLIALYDDNGISIDGPTSLSYSDDATRRFEAYGWFVQTIDGHDFEAIEQALTAAQTSDKPCLIRCQTTIGYGAPTKANTAGAHGSPLGADEIKGAKAALGWAYGPFEIPEEVKAFWRRAGTHGTHERTAWEARLKASPLKADWETCHSPLLLERVMKALRPLLDQSVEKPVSMATRQASGAALDVLLEALPELVGGSADLTPSNNTYKKGTAAITPPDYAGRYIHYGIREHGMATCMNGLALHGGLIPYGGTFLSFADYNRPAIRLAALMKTRVIHVMTHDSIGLGEDGPTHQPVEHLASLRAIPNCHVYRPCDMVETAECWALALLRDNGPSILALSRQTLPALRLEKSGHLYCGQGGYILRKNFTEGAPDRVLIASGSEVSLAVDAFEALARTGLKVQVVSMPCIELFVGQDADYKAEVLGGPQAKRVIIEAAIQQPWDKFMREGDVFIGMHGFGESAPAPVLYAHFGITSAAIIEAAS